MWASFLAIMASVIGLAGCTAVQQAQPPEVDPNASSLKLKLMMSEREVIDTLGSPKSADLGKATPKPWACKTLHYGTLDGSLMIQLGQDSTGTWRVNSWYVL